MLPRIELDHSSDVPLYRQLHEQLRSAIVSSRLVHGERLPATRELAGSLGLNRATVASAYELLEAEHLIKGHVGRGSFVEGTEAARLDWESLIPTEGHAPAPVSGNATISFAASRPSEDQFPLAEFRETCREVIDSDEASNILQLGPASGYGPLRRFLLDEARRRGLARELLGLAIAEAKARGIRVVTLHASRFGKPLYEQTGFEMSNEMRLRPEC